MRDILVISCQYLCSTLVEKLLNETQTNTFLKECKKGVPSRHKTPEGEQDGKQARVSTAKRERERS